MVWLRGWAVRCRTPCWKGSCGSGSAGSVFTCRRAARALRGVAALVQARWAGVDVARQRRRHHVRGARRRTAPRPGAAERAGRVDRPGGRAGVRLARAVRRTDHESVRESRSRTRTARPLRRVGDPVDRGRGTRHRQRGGRPGRRHLRGRGRLQPLQACGRQDRRVPRHGRPRAPYGTGGGPRRTPPTGRTRRRTRLRRKAVRGGRGARTAAGAGRAGAAARRRGRGTPGHPDGVAAG